MERNTQKQETGHRAAARVTKRITRGWVQGESDHPQLFLSLLYTYKPLHPKTKTGKNPQYKPTTCCLVHSSAVKQQNEAPAAVGVCLFAATLLQAAATTLQQHRGDSAPLCIAQSSRTTTPSKQLGYRFILTMERVASDFTWPPGLQAPDRAASSSLSLASCCRRLSALTSSGSCRYSACVHAQTKQEAAAARLNAPAA